MGLILLLWPPAANAQTVDGFLFTQVNPGAGTGGADQVEVTVALAGAPSFDLGTSTLMFTFNTDALAIPSGAAVNEPLVDGTDYQYEDPFIGDPGNGKFYGPSTVTVFGAPNRLSINIVLDVMDFGQPVMTSVTPIVTLFFDITDPNQDANLAWITSGDANPTVVQLDDNQTAVTLGTFSDDDTPLPVELTDFEAVVDGAQVRLHWETASETNNAGFELQARENGSVKAWERIAFVEGAGTTSEAQTYAYPVRDLDSGTHRFRLKQIDLDGTFDYSPEVEVTLDLAAAYVMTPPVPNPARGATIVEMAVREEQHVTVRAYDMLGRHVATLYDGSIPVNRTERLVLRGEHLPSGLYLVRAVGEGFTVTRRVTLVR